MSTSTFRSLVRLANPFHPLVQPAFPLSGIKWDDILTLADINRVLLTLFNNLKLIRESVPTAFWTSLEEQARLRVSVWKLFTHELAKMSVRLEETGLRWMLIKTVRGFAREIRDLDILIFDDEFRRFQEILAPLGYKKSGELSGFKMEVKSYRMLDGLTRVPVTMDVHSRIGYEGLTFIDEDEVWKSRRVWNCNGSPVAIPSMEHQLVTTILNSFFGDGGLRLSDIFELDALIKEGVNTSRVFEIARKYGWGNSAKMFWSTSYPLLILLDSSDVIDERASGFLVGQLPSYYRTSVLFLGLLEKGLHDIRLGGHTLVPSWGRLGMKFLSLRGHDRLRKDSWNEIFKR